MSGINPGEGAPGANQSPEQQAPADIKDLHVRAGEIRDNMAGIDTTTEAGKAEAFSHLNELVGVQDQISAATVSEVVELQGKVAALEDKGPARRIFGKSHEGRSRRGGRRTTMLGMTAVLAFTALASPTSSEHAANPLQVATAQAAGAVQKAAPAQKSGASTSSTQEQGPAAHSTTAPPTLAAPSTSTQEQGTAATSGSSQSSNEQSTTPSTAASTANIQTSDPVLNKELPDWQQKLLKNGLTITKANGKVTVSANSAPSSKANTADQASPNLGGTVSSAVERTHTEGQAQFRHLVIESYAHHLGQYNKLAVSHDGDRMVSMPNLNKDSSTNDVLEAGWYGVINDLQDRAGAWNSIHDRPVADPIDVSPHQQLHDIYLFLISHNLELNGDFQLNGLYANGAVSQADGHRYAEPTDFHGVRSVKMTADGHTLIWKVGGGSDGNNIVCINVQEKLAEEILSTPAPAVPVPVSHVVPKKPGESHHGHKHGHPGKPGKPGRPAPKPGKPGTPVVPSGGTPPPSTPPLVYAIKVATQPAGPNPADRSPGTSSGQESTIPVVTPPNTTTTTTTTPPEKPTLPTDGSPAAGEPSAPVVEGTPTSTPVATTPGEGDSTQPTASGGVAGQGGHVNAGSTANSSSGSN